MISEDIKYDFNQLQLGLIAFVSDIERKLKKILVDLPVYVFETGDISYYLDQKFIETTNDEVYQKTPRFVINIEDIQNQLDQNTNPYNKIVYKYKDEVYQATCRRSAIMIPLMTDFVSPNFILALENFEVLNSIMSKENAFTYEFLGNTYSAAYVLTQPSIQKNALDMSMASKNVIVKTSIEVSFNILTPRVETIKLLKDTGFDAVHFGINVLNSEGTIEHTDNLNTEE